METLDALEFALELQQSVADFADELGTLPEKGMSPRIEGLAKHIGSIIGASLKDSTPEEMRATAMFLTFQAKIATLFSQADMETAKVVAKVIVDRHAE